MFASSVLRNVLAMAIFLAGISLVWPLSVYATPSEPPRPVLAGVIQVSAGGGHTCVLTTFGGLKCWGSNEFGQIGARGGASLPFPADVPTLRSGVAAVSTRGAHTCALTTAGGVKCWGNNSSGELGDGTTTNRSLPADVLGLTNDVIAIQTSDSSSCAITVSGSLKCWGRIAGNSPVPVDILETGGSVKEVALGYNHGCLLNESGGAKCWGAGFQLGAGAIVSTTTPVDVVGLSSGVFAIAAGLEHTCALTMNGVKCWGRNDLYQVGDGTREMRSTPVDVMGAPPAVKAISTGGSHSCVLAEEGDVWCWGQNRDGQLGTGSTTPGPTATKVQGLEGPVRAISAGGSYTCALTDAGTVECWGSTWSGQLGTDATEIVTTPRLATGMDAQIAAIDMQGAHTCTIMPDRSIHCWGRNDRGQLGIGNWDARWEPAPVINIGGPVKWVDAGTYHTCAVTVEGSVKCWGRNTFGQLGNGDWYDTLVPVDVIGLDRGVAAVTAGQVHSCALLETGGVKCWGQGLTLGNGYAPDSPVPVDIPGLASGVAAIAAGEKHTCAFMQDRTVKCWQQNVETVTGFAAPVRRMVVGGFFNCALIETGGVQCWGSNTNDTLGTGGTLSYSATPLYVAGLQSGAIEVTAGNSHACARTMGGVYCWGAHTAGQTGDGTIPKDFWETRRTPVKVVGLDKDAIVSLQAGGSHTCVRLADRTFKCWGSNHSGQQGINPGWTPDIVRDKQSLFLPAVSQ